MSTNKSQATELSNKLWEMANNLRGTMEAYEFKNYILGLIFYKFLSDKTVKFFTEQLKQDGITYAEAWDDEEYHEAVKEESLERLGYIIEPKYLFESMIKMIEEGEFSIEYLEEGVNSIVESTQGQPSEEDFKGLFDDLDLKASRLGKVVSERTKAIGRMMQTIDTIEIEFDTTETDVLGEAYIQLISKFAQSGGSKGGEFFTNPSLSRLVAKLACVGLTDVKSVFDPTCGSGSLLLQVGQVANVRQYFGQELTQTTYNLARMNMMLHGVDYTNFKIVNCDTITNDEELQDNKYTICVANPPYSLNFSHDLKLLEDERFAPYGVLAPKGYADLMFVEHMIYHMDEDDGRIAVLLPHGVLFRGGAEKKIRQFMIENQNLLDAVIGLPAKTFTSTQIPVCCLIFRKHRNGNSGNICFIDASKEFKQEGKLNVLTEEIIDKIVDTYTERKEVEKYCHIASMDEIIENDFNLNIPRYVDTFEEEPEIDIEKVVKEIEEIREEKKKIEAELKGFFDELGVRYPGVH